VYVFVWEREKKKKSAEQRETAAKTILIFALCMYVCVCLHTSSNACILHILYMRPSKVVPTDEREREGERERERVVPILRDCVFHDLATSRKLPKNS